MNRDELLELAPLDALGLLDEYDALLFSRGFHAAPEHVRDEVRELQAAVAGDAALLPEVELPSGMRSRVITAVRREADEAVDLAPLATIGRSRRVEAMLTLDRPSMRPTTGIRPPRRFLGSLASQGWRAAAFALLASLIVAMYFGSQILDRNDELFAMVRQMQAEHSTANAMNELIDGSGDAWLLQARKPATLRIALVGADGLACTGMAYLDSKPREGSTSREGSILVQGLPAGDEGSYQLIVRAANGEIIAQAAVIAGPAVAVASFSVDDDAQLAGADFQITGADGAVWVASA